MFFKEEVCFLNIINELCQKAAGKMEMRKFWFGVNDAHYGLFNHAEDGMVWDLGRNDRSEKIGVVPVLNIGLLKFM